MKSAVPASKIRQKTKRRYLDSATVTPTVVDFHRQTFTGCVYDQSGQLVRLSQRTNKRVAWKPADHRHIDVNLAADHIDGQSLYLGHITSHYGHFLLETLSRFWALQTNSAFDTFVFSPFVHPVPDLRLFSPAKTCFECFGVAHERVLIVGRNTRFQKLLVPAALVNINNHADEEQALVYRQIADHCAALSPSRQGIIPMWLRTRSKPATPHRLYLSRRQLAAGFRTVINEEDIERLFESHGFTTIHPERLRFDEQVRLYLAAEIIAGFEGSAMHNSVFMTPGRLVITLGSGRMVKQNNRNQNICDGLAKVRSEFIGFHGTTLDPARQTIRFDMDYLQRALRRLL